MTSLNDNASFLLRYLYEQGAANSAHCISSSKLNDVLGQGEDEYRKVDNFLLASKLIQGGGIALKGGIRWLTDRGIENVRNEMQSRIPITIDSELILKFLIREIKDNEFLTQDEIIKEIKISAEQYHEACQQLVDFDFVLNRGTDEFPALIPTQDGRQAVHRNFRELRNSSNVQQIGAIFNAPITGGNIQAIASAINSQVQQNISTLSPDELHKEMEQILEQLLAQVTEHLTLQQKAAYTQMAAEFQTEIANARPDPSKLHKLLGGLGLLSDFGGAIDFSQKTFELVVKTGPYIILLSQMIVQLLHNLPH